jgi:RHS repeat-associated protein
MGSSNFTYDSNGNMTNDGSNTLVYDAENRVTSINSAANEYVYDGNSLRVKKCAPTCASPTSRTVYIFSGSKVIAEYDNGAAVGSPTREYLYAGSSLLARIDGSTTKYYHQDHLSNRLTTDSSGTALEQKGHFPFGEDWYQGTDKLKFTTYERDSESGNDYAMARYYVNRLGRFSSPDPLAGDIANPESLNRYSYVLNDPLNLFDPTGMEYACHWEGEDWDDTPQEECERDGGAYERLPGPSTSIYVNGGGGGGFGTGLPPGGCYSVYQDGVYLGTSCLGGTSGGTPGGGNSSFSVSVNRNFSRTFKCTSTASGVMNALENNFASFANNQAQGALSTFAVFTPGSLSPGHQLDINVGVQAFGHTFGYSDVSVTVQSMTSNQLVFQSDPGHVLYPARVSFSASNAGNGSITFTTNVSGATNGLLGTLKFYPGGGRAGETSTWNNLLNNVAKFCGN